MFVLLTLLASACGPPPTPTAVPCDTLTVPFWPHGLAFDHSGNLWAASLEGAWRLDQADGTCALFTEENGLAEDEVYAVAVDPDGDVWFGGYRHGDISRFDGRRWTTYTDYDGLPDDGNGIFDIAVAPDGTLWFGFPRYAYHFDGETWTLYTAEDGLPPMGVTAIAAAPDGTIWFGGMETTDGTGGLARFDGERWASFTENDGVADNDIHALAVAPDGTVWVGTSRGVSRFDGTKWVTYTENDGLADDRVNDIAVAPDGAVWFATLQGVSRFDGERWAAYSESDGLFSDVVLNIAVTPDGKVCAGMSGGVSCFDGERWNAYGVGTGLPLPSPTPSPSPSPTATSPPSPTPSPVPSSTATSSSPFRPASWPGEAIRHLWAAPDGQLWLTTDAGIFVRSDEAWEALYDGPGERVLGADTAGRVWALLEDGETVAAYDPSAATWAVFGPDQGWTTPPPPNYLGPGYGDGLVTDPQGRVWLATGRDDLRRFDPETQTWSTFRAADLGFTPPEEEDVQGHFLSDVALDGAGNVWVGDCIGMGEMLLGQGARWFDGERWHEAIETAGECVYDIEVDDGGRVWVGGFDALIRYDPATGAWSRIPLPDWERPQLVTEITLDTDGNPWVEFLRFGGAGPFGEVARYHLEEGAWVADYDPGGGWFSSLAFGPDGAAWLCAEGSVYRLAGGQTEEVGTVAASQCQVEVDGAGRVWVAGDAGLWRLDPRRSYHGEPAHGPG